MRSMVTSCGRPGQVGPDPRSAVAASRPQSRCRGRRAARRAPDPSEIAGTTRQTAVAVGMTARVERRLASTGSSRIRSIRSVSSSILCAFLIEPLEACVAALLHELHRSDHPRVTREETPSGPARPAARTPRASAACCRRGPRLRQASCRRERVCTREQVSRRRRRTPPGRRDFVLGPVRVGARQQSRREGATDESMSARVVVVGCLQVRPERVRFG